MPLWKRTPPGLLSFEAFGVPVQLSLEPPELEAAVQDILPPGWTPARPTASARRFALQQVGPDRYTTIDGDHPWIQNAGLDLAVGMLDSRIRLYIATDAREWTFVHAGVVASKGRAVMIPGLSFSGKSTLVKALIEAGATYYSDEYAVLDGEGRVHPYARRLSIRTPLATLERSASELGGATGEAKADVAMVVLTRYRPGSSWEPQRVTAGQGVTAVLANTVPARERPQQSLRVVGRALSGATVLQSDRDEAGPVAAALLEELAAIAR